MNMKKTVAILLIIAMAASFTGMGVFAEDSNTIHIGSADDLVKLAKNCSLDSYSTGKTVVLDNSIDLSGVRFNNIPYFDGLFNGNGFSITGFAPQSDGAHQGFFRYIGKNGEVKNLVVAGTVLPEGGNTEVGGIAGTNHGIIRNCVFEGTVSGTKDVGLIAGENFGTIRACKSQGQATGKRYVGGITGFNEGVVVECINYAEVNTTISETELDIDSLSVSNLANVDLVTTKDSDTVSDSGGIAGGSTGSLISCVNYGVVGYQHYGYNVGGIAGRQSGFVSDCENRGKVHGRQDVGGIVGQMEPYMEIEGATTLAEELEVLHDLVSVALGDSNNQTGDMTDILNNIQSDAAGASANANNLVNSVGTFIDNTVDTTNELLARADYFIKNMQPVTHNFNMAAQYFSSGMIHLDTAMDNLELDEETSAVLHENMTNLTVALGRMSDELTYLAYIASAYYNKEGDGSVNLDELKPSPEEQERLEKEYGYSFDLDDSSRKSQLKSAMLKCMSDLIVDAAKAQRAKTEIVKVLDEYYFTPIYDLDGDGEFETSRADMAREEGQQGREDLVVASEYLALATEGLDEINTYLASLDQVQYSKLGSEYYTSTDGLFYNINNMTGSMTDLNNQISDSSDVMTKDFSKINDQFSKVVVLLANAINGSADLTLMEDVSDTDTENNTEGKVSDCINYGEIDGDVNVGGISGAMGIETEMDMEGTVAKTLGVEGIFSNTYQTKCVIRLCINRGSVVSKKDNVGGVVGLSELGTVIAAEGYGNVSSTSGGYVGGIAGYSYSIVRDSYAMCNLDGNSYIGGIAGYGTKIHNCSSLIGVGDATECVGAVAGYADLSEEGNVTGNRFVQVDIGAIDGISYVGIAEPVSYSNLSSGKDVPKDFGDLKLTFIADGVVVKTISFTYGGAVDPSEIPAVPTKEGFTGSWPEYDYSAVYYSDTIEAIYTSNQATMAAESTRGDSPLSIILVEGSFDDGAKVLVNEYAGAGPAVDNDKSKILEKWVIRIDGDENAKDSYSVRYLAPEVSSRSKVDIYVLKNGEWTKTTTRTSGSYTVFDGDGTVVFSAVEAPANAYLWYIIGGGSGAAALAIASILIAKGSKKKKAAARRRATEE